MKKATVLISVFLIITSFTPLLAQTDYCTPTYNGTGSDSKWFSHILNVKFGTIDRATAAPYNYNFPSTMYDNLTSISTSVVPNMTYPISIYVGNGANRQYVTAWIDFNANKVFESGERVLLKIDYENTGDHIVRGNITIPSNAKIGTTRMRIGTNIILNQTQAAPDPCINNETANLANVGPIASQHFQDYSINILEPKIQYYVSSNTVQLLTTEEVTVGSTDNPIIRIDVTTNADGIYSPVQADTFFFSLLGTTNPNEISTAKLYYTGVNSEFSAANQVGTDINSPGTYFQINAAQKLYPGTNYFWLTYDTKTTSIIGNLLDARCNGVQVNVRRVPQTIDPKGTRKIGYCVSVGTKTFIYVRQVDLREISQYSYASYYADYTSRSATLYKGYYHPLSIETGNGVNSNATQAWIDFNQNGFFEPGEKVLDDSLLINTAPPYNYGPVIDSFLIPINAPVGRTRMRITTQYNPNGQYVQRPKPCANPVEIGEVEDYTIIIADSGQAVADFKANITCFGDSTTFTDLSYVFGKTYKVSVWQWDFGDGNSSTLQNPIHFYTTPGVYNVKLTVLSNFSGGVISSIIKPIKVNKPEPNFTITNNLYQTPITFIDETSGGEVLPYPNGNYWDFGDPKSGYNNFSQQKNPQHIFNAVGNYTIKMIVTTEGGCIDTFAKTIHIDSVIKPLADFSASTFNPYFDQKVEFLDVSVYDPTFWRWEISPKTFKYHDGTNKFSKQPMISFDNVGVYAVRLFAQNTAGGDSITKVINVKNYTKPVAKFSAKPTSVKAGQTVSFVDESTNDPTNWIWSFGDNDSAFVRHPNKSYSNTGYYTVSLRASNPAGNSTEIKSNLIQVSDEYIMCDSETPFSNLFAGKILDSGGRNNDYNNGSNCSFLIKPDCAGPITLKFTEFKFEANDYVMIYDGETADKKRLLTPESGYSGSSIPPSVTAKSGAMLIVEVTDEAAVAKGFIAEWSAAPNIKPKAIISANTLGYKNAPHKFGNGTTLGAGNTYYWDYQNDGVIDDVFLSGDIITDGRYAYNKLGSYTCKLKVENCKGSDSTTFNINIINPISAPVANFRVINDDTLVAEGERVYFEDLSTMGPTSWKWEITPPDYFSVGFFADGTADTSQNPIVQFYGIGGYHIALTSSNIKGSSNRIEKKKYIRVIPQVLMGTWPYEHNEEAGKIFDSGGEIDNYKNNENYTLLLDPCADRVYLDFLMFKLGSGDLLKVYDGVDENAKPLHTLDGFTAGNVPDGRIVAESGQMYIAMQTNSSGVSEGFEAFWSIDPTDKAVATFECPDTVYTGQYVTLFENKSTGKKITKYYWDYDFDSEYDDSTFHGQFAYTKTGYKYARLTVVNCAGSVTFAKMVTIVNPTVAPKTNFEADLLKADVSDEIIFSDKSLNGPNKWTWDFGTSDYTIHNIADTIFPRVVLNYDKPGVYDVKLKTQNKFGIDSLTKPSYIEIFDYCDPTVENLLKDFGISYIQINDLSNSSDAGITAYSDYTKTKSVNLELGGTYEFRILSTKEDYPFERKIWIDFNQDGVFDDSTIVHGELVALGKNQSSKIWTGSLSVPKTALLGQTRMRIGIDYGGYPNSPCGQNFFGEFEDYRVFITEDKTPPIITCNDPDLLVFSEINKTFTDPGATAFDAVDGDISSKIVTTNNVITTKVGQYWVKYNVTDNSGNVADEVVLKVFITYDITPPVLTLKGDNPMLVAVNYSYDAIEPGATSIDANDGDVSNLIQIKHSIDSSRVDTYKVIYSAYDKRGNSVSDTRTVYIADTIKPVITLKGDPHVWIAAGSNYIDSGATVTDNYYPSVTLKSLTTLDVNKDGWYTYKYNATDGSGNKAIEVERIIRVGDPLSINDEVLDNQISLYPNPTKSIVNVDFGNIPFDHLYIEIHNLLGETIFQQNLNDMSGSTFQIDLSGNAEGIYFVKFNIDQQVCIRKVTLVK